jgi:hypothetical protein
MSTHRMTPRTSGSRRISGSEFETTGDPVLAFVLLNGQRVKKALQTPSAKPRRKRDIR